MIFLKCFETPSLIEMIIFHLERLRNRQRVRNKTLFKSNLIHLMKLNMNSFTLGIKNHLMNQTEDNSINAGVYHLQFEESLIIYKRQLIQVLKICYSLYKALLEIFLINNDYYCT